MEAKPLVSVLMTSYNREKYIAEAIESVLASTYANFELIISDDRSADKTVEIAKHFAAADSRVKVFINEKNLGDYSNRNQAASYATGKYLKYVDADDLIYPWGLQVLVSCMEQFPNAGWGLCSLEQDEKKVFPFLLTPEEIYKYAYLGQGLFHKAPLSSIIKTEVFKAVGGFSGKQHLGDFELWHLLALKYNLVVMPHGIVWHRVHDEQQSRDNRTDRRVSFKYTVSAYNFFKSCTQLPLDKKTTEEIIEKLRKSMSGTILKCIMKTNLKDALNLYKMTKDTKLNFGKG